MATSLATIPDPIFRPDENPHFDAFQGTVRKFAQGFILDAGTEISEVRVRIGRFESGFQHVRLQLRDSDHPSGGPLTDSSQVFINDLVETDSNSPSQDDDLDVVVPFTSFTFDPPFVATGVNQFIIVTKTGTVSPFVTWRRRESDPYADGEAWQFTTDWTQLGVAGDFDMEMGPTPLDTLYITNTGFRFPYQRWT